MYIQQITNDGIPGISSSLTQGSDYFPLRRGFRSEIIGAVGYRK